MGRADTYIDDLVSPLTGPGFKVTGGKGFHITFENGWTVSVQFGHYNYCEHYVGWSTGLSSVDVPIECASEVAEKGSRDAEVAIWSGDGAWLVGRGGASKDVLPSQSVADVAGIICTVADLPDGSSAKDYRLLRAHDDSFEAIERRATDTHGEDG